MAVDILNPLWQLKAPSLGRRAHCYEEGKCVVLELPVEGCPPEELEISLRGHIMTIRCASNARFHFRAVLPADVDPESAVACVYGGLMSLTFLKSESRIEEPIFYAATA